MVTTTTSSSTKAIRAVIFYLPLFRTVQENLDNMVSNGYDFNPELSDRYYVEEMLEQSGIEGWNEKDLNNCFYVAEIAVQMWKEEKGIIV